LVSWTSPFSELATRNPDVRVPRLLFHDDDKYILIIEDLGELQTVDKWLETTLSTSAITTTASKLGSFLADFHLCTSPHIIPRLQEEFKNDDAMEVVFSAAVEPVLGILQEYQIPDAPSLYEFVAAEFKATRQETQSHILCMGDLWTGSILVGEDGKIGVIDWEFATMGAPSQDIGQLGS
jgi:5-methylthioribose kinase